MVVRPTTLNEWAAMVDRIYGECNDRQNLTTAEILNHVVEEAGDVARDFRQMTYARLHNDVADVFVWLCAFTNAYTVPDLGKTVWHKFPRMCPYCYQKRDCNCSSKKNQYIEDSPTLVDARNTIIYRKWSLDDWEKMFRNIYGSGNDDQREFVIGFHLEEELGEIARELRGGDATRGRCLDEIADAFAWIFAIAAKANQVLESKQRFSETVWNLYPNKCKVCGNQVCTCCNN